MSPRVCWDLTLGPLQGHQALSLSSPSSTIHHRQPPPHHTHTVLLYGLILEHFQAFTLNAEEIIFLQTSPRLSLGSGCPKLAAVMSLGLSQWDGKKDDVDHLNP